MKGYQPQAVAISAGDHKHAALFFDEVYPMHSLYSVPDEIAPKGKLTAKLGEADITDMIRDVQRMKPGEDFPPSAGVLTIVRGSWRPDMPDAAERLKSSTVLTADQARVLISCLAAIQAFQNTGRYAVPILDNDPEEVDALMTALGAKQYGAHEIDSCVLTLAHVPLVDTTNATWEQVLELRKDEEARRMLRNFRLWFASTYAGKGAKFIRDHLAFTIEKYESACHKHGLDLNTGAVTAILSSRVVKALGSASIAALFLDPNWAKMLGCATLGDLLFEVGHAFVSRRQKRLNYLKDSKHSEMAYVFRAKELIEGAP